MKTFILTLILMLSLVPGTKAQLFKPGTLKLKLVHNNQTIRAYPNPHLKNTFKPGDTIQVHTQTDKPWIVDYNPKHKKDTTAVIKRIRYQCRQAVVIK